MAYSASTQGFSTSGGPSFAQTSDSASGTTHAAVSPGTITVKSDQQSGTDSTAGLSRDTTNANQTVQNTFNLQQVQNNLAFAQAFGKTATYAAGQIADQLENNNPAFAEGGVARDAMHAAVAAIGAALSGGNIAGAVGGSLAGDALQSLAQPIIEQAVSQVPPESQAALRNALNEVVAAAGGAAGGALAGGGSSGAIAGAGSASNNEVYNRQLNNSERQWAANNATAFAKFYEAQTGQTITAAQAQQMLLANGYIDVDAKAAAGGLGYNATAAQYISANSNGLFHATTADYNNPFANGTTNGLSPEQSAMPGAVPNPALGLGIAGILSGGALLPALGAIPGAPILGVDGALGSGAMASTLGVGGIAGAVNATSQYIQTGSVNPVDVMYAAIAGSVAGAIGESCALLCNVGINAATGAADTYTNNKISNKSDSILTGAAVNGAAAGLGYGIGVAFQSGMTALSNSAMNGYNWAGTGTWAGQAGTNLFNPNNLPTIGAAVGGSAGSEIGTAVINYGKSKVGK